MSNNTTGFIKFDEGAYNSAISICKSMNSTVNKAQQSISAALNSLNTLASAGGDLMTANGENIKSKVNKGLTALNNTQNRAKKLQTKLGNVVSVFKGADSLVGGAAVATVLREMFLNNETSDGIRTINDYYTAGHDVLDLADRIGDILDRLGDGSGSSEEMAIDILDVAGDVASKLTNDPYASVLLGNVGDTARSLSDLEQQKDAVFDGYDDGYRSGEYSLSEKIGGQLGAAVTYAATGVADIVLNLHGIDIPSSITQPVIEFGGKVGSVVVEGATWVGDKIWSGLKSIF